ncbi:hypothetical protein QQ045_004917 [Rhodiola kirilowii]
MAKEEDSDDDMVCLDESFFINDDYQLATFTFGSHTLELFCLQSASTDFDLTGQIIWPGAMLMNDFLSKNVHILQGCSVIELGSGAGITGLLCSRFCSEILLTDHNAEVLKILKKNIQHHTSYEDNNGCADLAAEKLEWGDSHDINQIMQNHPKEWTLWFSMKQQYIICRYTRFLKLDPSLETLKGLFTRSPFKIRVVKITSSNRRLAYIRGVTQELITACTISSMFHKVKKEKGSMDVNIIGPGGLFHAAF